MSLFDRMLSREAPGVAVHQFWSQMDWLRYHLDVGGGIGVVDINELRTGWKRLIDDEAAATGGTPWGASDDSELEALVAQANTAIATGEALAAATGTPELADWWYRLWSDQGHKLFMGMENVLAANKVSKGEANQYLLSIANGTVDISDISPATITP